MTAIITDRIKAVHDRFAAEVLNACPLPGLGASDGLSVLGLERLWTGYAPALAASGAIPDSLVVEREGEAAWLRSAMGGAPGDGVAISPGQADQLLAATRYYAQELAALAEEAVAALLYYLREAFRDVPHDLLQDLQHDMSDVEVQLGLLKQWRADVTYTGDEPLFGAWVYSRDLVKAAMALLGSAQGQRPLPAAAAHMAALLAILSRSASCKLAEHLMLEHAWRKSGHEH